VWVPDSSDITPFEKHKGKPVVVLGKGGADGVEVRRGGGKRSAERERRVEEGGGRRRREREEEGGRKETS
jgi:hypothetical protein